MIVLDMPCHLLGDETCCLVQLTGNLFVNQCQSLEENVTIFTGRLGHRFAAWIAGSFVSNVGSWMQGTAQSWVVLTQLSNNDAVTVGAVMSLQFAPSFILVAPAGWVADRLPRKTTLLITQLLQGLLAAILGLLLIQGVATVDTMYVFALLLGIVSAFDNPSRQAFVNDLLPENDIAQGVAMNAAAFNAARLVGPALAGLLLAVFSSGWVFVINAFTYLAVIVVLLSIRLTAKNTQQNRTREKESTWDGFRFVLRRKDLVSVLALAFIVGAFSMNFPIFSSTMSLAFGKGSETYGVLSSEMAIGSLIAALLATRRKKVELSVMLWSTLGISISSLGMALSPTVEKYGAVSILMGFCVVTLLTTANGYIQVFTPAKLRGRVLAIFLALLAGSTPIGAPLVSLIAQNEGPRWALATSAFTAAAIYIVILLWNNQSKSQSNSAEEPITTEFGSEKIFAQANTVSPLPPECHCR
ncbi:MFS transporter [Aurantimicrobium minutum]|uniref:MFS transporter n=1 Tax=Aurantimicrobium minutum TaxID=708131 RepID=UPI0024737481|nr:MFS transporter [Aurantimicrobium minutum]MDH6422275.1 MFS family permease [Aurantimicrobium minutum]